MTVWADYVALAGLLMMLGGWKLVRFCFRKAEIHAQPCTCEACVGTALESVRRDTEKVSQ